jgi:hypothetical protein
LSWAQELAVASWTTANKKVHLMDIFTSVN